MPSYSTLLIRKGVDVLSVVGHAMLLQYMDGSNDLSLSKVVGIRCALPSDKVKYRPAERR
jgi:hypothetical protein